MYVCIRHTLNPLDNMIDFVFDLADWELVPSQEKAQRCVLR